MMISPWVPEVAWYGDRERTGKSEGRDEEERVLSVSWSETTSPASFPTSTWPQQQTCHRMYTWCSDPTFNIVTNLDTLASLSWNVLHCILLCKLNGSLAVDRVAMVTTRDRRSVSPSLRFNSAIFGVCRHEVFAVTAHTFICEIPLLLYGTYWWISMGCCAIPPPVLLQTYIQTFAHQFDGAQRPCNHGMNSDVDWRGYDLGGWWNIGSWC